MVIVVDAKLSQAEKDGIASQINAVIEKVEGKIVDSNVWLEKQKFTFPMKKALEGTYYLYNLELKGSAVTPLRDTLKLNEKVLRHLIVKIVEKKAKTKA